MTLNEYQTLAARTIATDDKAEMESHALYGLTAEIGELMDSCFGTDVDHTIKECGDVCWMIADLCTAHEWFLGDIVQDLGLHIPGRQGLGKLEQPVGKRALAVVDMGYDAEVPDMFHNCKNNQIVVHLKD